MPYAAALLSARERDDTAALIVGRGAAAKEMHDPIVLGLLAIGLLQFKHFLCDFIFQSERHVKYKGVYGHPVGIQHSGIHAIGTIPCLLIVGVVPLAATGIALAEFVVHYHTDWAKEQITRRAGWTPAEHMFWNALGADQLIHHFTYLAIVCILVRWAL